MVRWDVGRVVNVSSAVVADIGNGIGFGLGALMDVWGGCCLWDGGDEVVVDCVDGEG